MPHYAVILEKTYCLKADPEQTETIYGTIVVEAHNSQDAQNKIEIEMSFLGSDGECKSGMQTVDPRIVWGEMEDIDPDDAEYLDFSFGIAQDELPMQVIPVGETM
jgi:hypothetical protein